MPFQCPVENLTRDVFNNIHQIINIVWHISFHFLIIYLKKKILKKNSENICSNQTLNAAVKIHTVLKMHSF